jgi:hypothetical protein
VPGEFDKDFGYLIPFLDKVARAAGSLSSPAARDELTRLVGGEKERWARIQQLLAGASGVTSAPNNPAPAPKAESPQAPDEPRPPQFTVGRLKGRDT